MQYFIPKLCEAGAFLVRQAEFSGNMSIPREILFPASGYCRWQPDSCDLTNTEPCSFLQVKGVTAAIILINIVYVA